MPHRRKPERGSFGGHFDELVAHFRPGEETGKNQTKRSREFQEKVDIHSALFERAWKLYRER